MSKREQIWNSLNDKEYRELFASDVGTGLAFQIKSIRESRGWAQQKLGELTGKAQETISQLENPDYKKYSLATLTRLAAAFDVALIVKFAPFSELVDSMVDLTPQALAPQEFQKDSLAIRYEFAGEVNIQDVGANDGFVMFNTDDSYIITTEVGAGNIHIGVFEAGIKENPPAVIEDEPRPKDYRKTCYEARGDAITAIPA